MTIFDGCWAKIQRGKKHRDDLFALNESLRANRGSYPTLGIRYLPQSGEGILYVSGVPDLTSDFIQASLIIGDAVHNFRSTLDHLAFALSAWNEGGTVPNPRVPQFPITDCRTGKGGWAQKSGQQLKYVHANHRAVIEGLQTYHRMDQTHSVGMYFHPLKVLRELDDSDKHRLLPVVMIGDNSLQSPNPVAYAIWTSGMFARSTQGPIAPQRVELGAEVARVRVTDRFPDMKVAAYVPPTIAFEDGRPAVAVLDKLGVNVIRIVRKFADAMR